MNNVNSKSTNNTENNRCNINDTSNQLLPNRFKCRGTIDQQEIVIFCDPMYPMKWLELILEKSKKAFTSSLSIHRHSATTKLPRELENFCRNIKNDSQPILNIVFIWKNVGIDPILKTNCCDDVFGAMNIARYLNRLIESVDSTILKYESKGSLYSCEINFILDKIHHLLHNGNSINEISSILGKTRTNAPLLQEFSIVDIILQAK